MGKEWEHMDQISIDMNKLTIQKEDLLSATAEKIINALNQELTERYPEDGANHFRLDADEVKEGRGAFYIAYVNTEPIGCGAIRLIDSTTAEIKRMYVARRVRGFGIGTKILMVLEAEAIRLGANRVVLETGERQPEALTLYTKAGFFRIPSFGEYVSSPLSVCMGKNI
jgi:putative acetyltransferase